MTDILSIGAGIAAFAVLGPSLAVGMIASKALEGMARQPEMAQKLLVNGIIFSVLCEGLGIIAAVIGLMIAGKIR